MDWYPEIERRRDKIRQFPFVPNTKGFRPNELLQHFADHGSEFGISVIGDYARLADDLWKEPRPPTVVQCTRMSGETVRFDTVSQAYGVVDNDNYIKTLFIPVPCSSLSQQERAKLRVGGCHKYADNMTYFRMGCRS